LAEIQHLEELLSLLADFYQKWLQGIMEFSKVATVYEQLLTDEKVKTAITDLEIKAASIQTEINDNCVQIKKIQDQVCTILGVVDFDFLTLERKIPFHPKLKLLLEAVKNVEMELNRLINLNCQNREKVYKQLTAVEGELRKIREFVNLSKIYKYGQVSVPLLLDNLI
jgi:hypothetical protein